MKQIRLLFTVLSFPTLLFAQAGSFSDAYLLYQTDPREVRGGGGLGITSFGNDVFYTLNFSPDLAFGKVGIGLDINLRISQSGQLRQEDWNDGISSYLRLIRYVRYGNKRDSLYIRVGQLDFTRLGHGSIVNFYRNNGSYDARRIGVEFDMDFGNYGFESMVSDLSNFNIVGIRAYNRPLFSTDIPILSNLQIGASYVADFSRQANVTRGGGSVAYSNSRELFFDSLAIRRGNLTVIGFDMGLPLLRLPIFELDTYLDVAKIIGYGSGLAIGVTGTIPNVLGAITLSSRLEHRVVGDQFQFAYFDALYEQDRFLSFENGQIITRANELANFSAPGPGVYGDLGGSILGKVRLFGSYQRLYRTPRGGQLHLGARLDELIPSVLFRADYYKRDLGFETELFTLDDRSLSIVEVGYFPYPYLLLSMIYQWTYLPVRNDDGTILRYEPIRRIEPRVTFQFNF
ncbi:MAG: hypothetical protein ACK412_09905 [Chloroherpetonaceae bacterium]